MPSGAGHAPRLTVAIPLFEAARWADNIASTLGRLPADALIVLSDETGSDDTAQRLARRFAGDRRIRVRIREGRPGWREHCNALIESCETELFSLLPQDDTVVAGHHERLVAALDAHPGAGVAFGRIVAEGLREHPVRLRGPPFRPGARPPWEEAILLERRWNLGIPFRGVIRRSVLRTIPATPGDQFADQVWVFGLALTAHLFCDPRAVYVKRYHVGNTHRPWVAPSREARRSQLIGEIARVLGDGDVARQALAFLDHVFAQDAEDARDTQHAAPFGPVDGDEGKSRVDR